jgi:hypothetical protein
MSHRAGRILLALLPAVACGDDGRQTSATSPLTTAPTSITSDTATGSSSATATDPTSDGPTTGATGTSSPVTTATTSTTADPTATTSDATTNDATTEPPPCNDLKCQVDPCGGDPKKTKLKGLVFAPEGTLPLYNITVYIPNAPLDPVAEGVACDTCTDGLPGDPIVATLTNTKGEFVLEGVPTGKNIPLVVSVGKWRREAVIPEVVSCVDNLAPYDLTRLPKNKSEGHIPKIALVTGGADPLECLLRKIGLEDAEFTPVDGDGRVNLFNGKGGANKYDPNHNGGASFQSAGTLWNSLDALKKYDIVLMACEGGTDIGNKSTQARQNVADYAGLGGRLFLSHWHNVWIDQGPQPWPTTATFVSDPDLPNPSTGKIDTSFPKGQALADWMINVGGSQVAGEMTIAEGQHTINAVNPDTSTRWVYTEAPVPSTVQYYTFNAPVGVPAEQQCGRVVDSDIHVSSGDTVGAAFPTGCKTNSLSPQEKALVFMLFELSACLIPDDMDPIPG